MARYVDGGADQVVTADPPDTVSMTKEIKMLVTATAMLKRPESAPKPAHVVLHGRRVYAVDGGGENSTVSGASNG
jgi:hypothetical protein